MFEYKDLRSVTFNCSKQNYKKKYVTCICSFVQIYSVSSIIFFHILQMRLTTERGCFFY